MYDSLIIQAESDSLIAKYLTDVTESTDQNTGEVKFKGKLKNLRINQNGRRISIIGSIPKYYFGNNCQTLTCKETEKATEKLGDELHLTLKEARIYSLEFGDNLLVDKSPGEYYCCLGETRFLLRSNNLNGESLYYFNKSRSLKFYDKAAELKSRKAEIPEWFKNKNVLRYELKYKNSLGRQLKKPKIFFDDLYNPNLFNIILKNWEKEFFSIERLNLIKIKNLQNMPGVTPLVEGLAVEGLHKIGVRNVLTMIDGKKKDLGKSKVSRMRGKVKRLSNHPDFTIINTDIRELDKRVKESVQTFKA